MPRLVRNSLPFLPAIDCRNRYDERRNRGRVPAGVVMSLPAPDPDAPSAGRLPRNVRVLGGTSLLNDVASEMVYPLLPGFLLSLGGSVAHLGLITGVAESASSLLKLFSGGWSDR